MIPDPGMGIYPHAQDERAKELRPHGMVPGVSHTPIDNYFDNQPLSPYSCAKAVINQILKNEAMR